MGPQQFRKFLEISNYLDNIYLLTSFTHKSIIITIKLECVTRFKNITIGHFIGHQTVDSRVPELAFVLNFKILEFGNLVDPPFCAKTVPLLV